MPIAIQEISPPTDDARLLDAYVLRRDREALSQLIARHLPFVYASSLRQMRGDAHAAEDVAQAVCILLALKPPRLRHSSNPSAAIRNWLFVTTRYAAKNAMKMHNRRTYHERHAAMLRAETQTSPSSIDSSSGIDALLDDALANLNQHDRAGVIMSYLENRTFAEVGRMLGVTEEAARKRVSRAIQKMRTFFDSRGVVVQCATIGSVLHAHAAIAPPFSITTTAATSAWAAAIGSGASAKTAAALIADGAHRMIAIAKLKVAAAMVLGASVVTVAAAPRVVAMLQQPPAAGATSSAPAPAAPADGVVQQQNGRILFGAFSNGVMVEIVGITRIDGAEGANGKWWAGNGQPVDRACDRVASQDDPPHTHQICFRVVDPQGNPVESSVTTVVNTGNYSSSPATLKGAGTGAIALSTRVPKDATLDFTVRVALGGWETVLDNEHPTDSFVTTKDKAAFMFAPVTDSGDGKCMIVVTDQLQLADRRILAVDENGQEHEAKGDGSVSANGITQVVCYADLPAAQVKVVRVQVKRHDHMVQFKNLTIDPEKPTQPQAIVSEPAK